MKVQVERDGWGAKGTKYLRPTVNDLPLFKHLTGVTRIQDTSTNREWLKTACAWHNHNFTVEETQSP